MLVTLRQRILGIALGSTFLHKRGVQAILHESSVIVLDFDTTEIVSAIRKRFGEHVMIVARGDSGFCRDELIGWIEEQPNMCYVLGLARTMRLEG